MRWKDWSSAWKGAIIGIIINLFTIILENVLKLNIPQTIPSKPYILTFLLSSISMPESISILVAMIIYALYFIEIIFYWFLTGALMGWIIGKVKVKKRK